VASRCIAPACSVASTSTCFELIARRSVTPQPLADRSLMEGDRTGCCVAAAATCFGCNRSAPSFLAPFLNPQTTSCSQELKANLRMVEVLATAGSTLAGQSLRENCASQPLQRPVLVTASRQCGSWRERLASHLREGDVLLLQGPQDANPTSLQGNQDLIVLRADRGNDLPTVSRKGVAILIAGAGESLLPSLKVLPLVASCCWHRGDGGHRCLRTVKCLRSIRLDVILLLGSLSSFSVPPRRNADWPKPWPIRC